MPLRYCKNCIAGCYSDRNISSLPGCCHFADEASIDEQIMAHQMSPQVDLIGLLVCKPPDLDYSGANLLSIEWMLTANGCRLYTNCHDLRRYDLHAHSTSYSPSVLLPWSGRSRIFIPGPSLYVQTLIRLAHHPCERICILFRK